jgi:uncharacterized protein HemX
VTQIGDNSCINREKEHTKRAKNHTPRSVPLIGDDMTSSRDEVHPAPPAATAARGRNDALWAGLATTVVPVALGLMLGIAYLGYAHVQRQMKAQHAELQSQHAELQSLKDKIQGMAAAQSRTGVEQSQPSMSEIKGLLNHVDTLRVQPKQRHPKQQKQ